MKNTTKESAKNAIEATVMSVMVALVAGLVFFAAGLFTLALMGLRILFWAVVFGAVEWIAPETTRMALTNLGAPELKLWVVGACFGVVTLLLTIGKQPSK